MSAVQQINYLRSFTSGEPQKIVNSFRKRTHHDPNALLKNLCMGRTRGPFRERSSHYKLSTRAPKGTGSIWRKRKRKITTVRRPLRGRSKSGHTTSGLSLPQLSNRYPADSRKTAKVQPVEMGKGDCFIHRQKPRSLAQFSQIR